MDFEDEKQATIWIPTNQVPRRNLEEFRRYEIIRERDKLKKLREKILKKKLGNLAFSPNRMVGNGQNKVGNGGKDLTNLVNSIPNPNEISDKNDNNGPVSTRKKIADELVVGEGTV